MSPSRRATTKTSPVRSPTSKPKNFTPRVKQFPSIYQPQKNSVWNVMRKKDKEVAGSDTKSAISKHDLSFGKDDDVVSQMTAKREAKRPSLAASPSASARLYTSQM